MSTQKEVTSSGSDQSSPPPTTTCDPYLILPSNHVSDGDYVLLIFADKRQIFAQALSAWRGKSPPLKINKRSYDTSQLIGLPYGSVLELDLKLGLVVLPEGEDIIPNSTHLDALLETTNVNDNRDLMDNNESQKMTESDIAQMRSDSNVSGSSIVKAIIQNSSTFESKTNFSKQKYIKKKQMKYQPRCRLTKCTASTICHALHTKDQRRMMNLREDSLAQILSFANISAGCKVLCYDTCCGVVTGSCAQRMGGYGLVYSIYAGQVPAFVDLIGRFNLSFVEHTSIRWLHTGQVFHDKVNVKEKKEDQELIERNRLEWPCHLLSHTLNYVQTMKSDEDRLKFIEKRTNRFARKLTRPTSNEVLDSFEDPNKPCDSLILACNYDPTHTLLTLLPYLGASCPFVVFYEYLEPLVECFREIQRQGLAINLRLSDTWMREYQILPNRTHPNMTMSQNGGFILTGLKLCPIHGKEEINLDDETMRHEKRKMTGRIKKRPADSGNDEKRKKNKES